MFDAASYLSDVFGDCVRSQNDLHDYQSEAVDWLDERPFSALFIDVGMGKTVIVESLLDRLFTNGFTGKVLVIAPIRVATRVWMREHRLWRHLAYFDPELIRIDDDDERVKQYGQKVYDFARSIAGKTPADAAKERGKAETQKKHDLRQGLLYSKRQTHVINKEAFDWLVSRFIEVGANGKLRQVKRWPYKVVIFDESSALGDHNTEIFKALKRVRPFLKRFHQLTATPASQTYMRFFSQINLLDQGERFGKHITPFREKYFNYNPYIRSWKIRDGAAEEIEQRIADICLVMRRTKDFIIHTRPVRLLREVMQQYRDFERDSILELPNDIVIDAISGAALSNKLLQFASGAVYESSTSRNYHVIHDEKIDELRQLADETLDQPIMVAYWYRSSLDRLRKAFPKALTMDREGKIEEQWNTGKHKMMFVHPRGVAHGMNLQAGGHHVALFDIFWPLELFTQLIGRLDRQGQTDTVMVHLLSTVGTHDQVVSANLELLQSAEEAMFRRLQALRRKLVGR